ncbi:MAG: MATE family efflux transporter [Lachnospiraceae bacterium]|nr:MATE family efflux transporter [Lachnospiraceae bacterium]
MIKRNDAIVAKKFMQLLIPAFGTAVAVSLNEFVDSIMVSNLIGSEAMAIVNLGTPILLLAACMQCLFGIGGSVVYSRYMGNKEEDAALSTWRTTIVLAAISGILIMLVGLIIRRPLADILAGNTGLNDQLYPYLFYLFLSVPFVVVIMSISSFLPALNHPTLGSICAIMANGVNLLMDYVYIKWLGFGVEGAALATMTGYIVSGIFLIVLFARKTIVVKKAKADLKKVGIIARAGLTNAFTQLGFAVSWSFCNSLASALGNDVVVSYAFFMQLSSIVSIFLAGICDGAVPLYSLLYGAGDKKGIKLLTKKAGIILEISAIGLVILFCIFPGVLFRLFNIVSPVQQTMCLHAIYAFAIFAPIRSFCVLYRSMLNAMGWEKYASLQSILDNIVGVMLFSFLGVKLMGANGLWDSYVVKILALVLILVVFALIYHRRHPEYSRFYLFPERAEACLLDVTLMGDDASIANLSQQAVQNCRDNGFDERTSMFAGLLLEEMALYTRHQCGEGQLMDILLKNENGSLAIDFRSIGQPFNPLMENERDEHFNVTLLNELPEKVSYLYTMGLNTTTLLLSGEPSS